MTKIAIAALVAVHFAVAVWHGNAHTALAVTLPPAKNAFVIIVIVIAPLVALSVLWTRYAVAAVWIFFLSMLGALLFGVYHHFVMVSPDHVAHLPAGSADDRSAFVTTASALAGLELIAVVYGAVRLRSVGRRSPAWPSATKV
jgi:hypothetical protein